jgi:AraC-like DNA-binding protein/ligand-binding sensor protein
MKPLISNQDRKLVAAIQDSSLYRGYQEAFRLATGMSMFLRLGHTEQIPREGERAEQNGFCQAMSGSARCAQLCSAAHDGLRARESGAGKGCSGSCFARMMETAVPLRCGGSVVAWLWTGQVFVQGEGSRSFNEVASVLTGAGCDDGEVRRLRQLWEATPAVGAEKYRGIVVLLEAFARQLADFANRLVIASRPQEPAAVTKARHFIRENLTERLTLEDVSRHSGLSPHHFCKVFRKSAGVNLIEYINRSRVEIAKQLLVKDCARVSEVAFDIGYQSLSQFNRSFRSITGESPTQFRQRLLKPAVLKRAA